MTKFERIVKFSPAFDKRTDNPETNCGIGSCRISFILKKGKKAVQFVISTDWYLPSTVLEYQNSNNSILRGIRKDRDGFGIEGWDVGYHSPKPMYKDHSPIGDDCDITGGKCYYDGSGLVADGVRQILISEGSEGVWKYLEGYFNDIFGKPLGKAVSVG